MYLHTHSIDAIGILMSSPATRVVVHSSTRFGPPGTDFLRRVIGTQDIRGKGTLHSLEREVDPFIFLDEAELPPGKKPPFGRHPHTGLVACTIPFSKAFASMLWDNHRGVYGPLYSGGLFQISAGKGVLHDEGADVDPELLRERFGDALLEAEKDSPMHAVQLWFNPGIGQGREEAPSEALILDPAEIPQVSGVEGCIDARVLLGEFGGARSPAKLWSVELVLLECRMAAGSAATLPLTFPTAWVYVLKDSPGGLRVASGDGEAADCGVQQIAVAAGETPGSSELALKLTTEGDAVHFLLGAGKPLGLPWCKLLGHDGALIGPSEAPQGYCVCHDFNLRSSFW